MTIPHQLHRTEWCGEPILVATPSDELLSIGKEVYNQTTALTSEQPLVWERTKCDEPLIINIGIEDNKADIVGLRLYNECGEEVGMRFDFKRGVFTVDRTKSGNVDFHAEFASVSEAPLSTDSEQNATIFVDSNSVECYTNIAALSNLLFPSKSYSHLECYAIGGSAKVELKLKN
jgi:fructan beta-fructosidase